MEAGFGGGNLSWAPGGHAYSANDFSDKVIRQGFIRKVFGMSILGSARPELVDAEEDALLLMYESAQGFRVTKAECSNLYTAHQRFCSRKIEDLVAEHTISAPALSAPFYHQSCVTQVYFFSWC